MRSLDFEEPLIIRAYAPLIRLLRTESSNRALDFYVIVKSHVTRISRMIQPFSMDPTILQRVQNLQLRFEFEVQKPPEEEFAAQRNLPRKKTRASRVPAARRLRKIRAGARRSKRAHPLSERVQRMAKRGKPLVRKLELTRRRARR